MLGYAFVFLALFAGIIKGYCGKQTSNYTKNLGDALFANCIRMILCIIIGLAISILTLEPQALLPSKEMLFIGMISGISTSIFVVSWLLCVKRSAYMLLEVFVMLGVLIPLIGSNFFFEEEIKLTQWLGMLLLLAAVMMMCSYNNSVKSKITPSSLILLVVSGASCGIADFSQKCFMKLMPDASPMVFNLYTYIFAALTLIVAYLFSVSKGVQTEKATIKKIVVPIAIMAICLFMNSYFKTLAAKHLDAILLYPLNQGCALILSSLMAVFLFKEKLSIKAICGIVIAFIGLIVINLL